MAASCKEGNGHYRRLSPSVGGVLLLPPATPASLPPGVPDLTSVAELAVQSRVGARGLFQAPTAIAVLVLLAADHGISLRVKSAVCSPRHPSERSRALTEEQAGNPPSLRRRGQVQENKDTAPCRTLSIQHPDAASPGDTIWLGSGQRGTFRALVEGKVVGRVTLS